MEIEIASQKRRVTKIQTCRATKIQTCRVAKIQKRRAAEMNGRIAENFVADAMQLRGFCVLAQRMRTVSGEIDLVMADAERLVFVEVKARKNFAEAAYAILPRQQRRLLDAASYVLATHEDWRRDEIRFDVALVSGNNIEHLEDAIRYN